MGFNELYISKYMKVFVFLPVSVDTLEATIRHACKNLLSCILSPQVELKRFKLHPLFFPGSRLHYSVWRCGCLCVCCNVVEAIESFISRDAGRCKAAASLPGSSGGEKSACVCQVTNQPLEVFVIIFLCTVWIEGFGTQRLRMSAEL